MPMQDGAIRIETVPDNANVYINENLVGITPLDITDVAPGRYRCSIQSGDYYTNQELDVHLAKIIHIKIDFITNIKQEIYLPVEEQPQNENQSPRPTTTPTSPAQPPTPTTSPTSATSTNLEDILKELQKLNTLLGDIKSNTSEKSPETIGIYDKSASILNSVPTVPEDTNSDLYQFENIHDVLQTNSKSIHVYNDGPGLLFVIVSTDGIQFTDETLIYEGEHKEYTNVNKIGLRSPTKGLLYRVTERMVMSQSSQIFSGSRFKERRDRLGTVLYHDEMESPTLKFGTTTVAAPGTITRTTDTAYSGDFSVKSIAGAGGRNIIIYEHIDFHASKLGVQIRFSGIDIFGGAFTIFIDMIHVGPTLLHIGQVSITNTGVLSLLTAGNPFTGTFVQFGTTIPIINTPNVWHVIKLAIDISSGFYVSFIIDGEKFDLSGFQLNTQASGGARQELQVDIANEDTSGRGNTIFYDDYIFTEDEGSLASTI